MAAPSCNWLFHAFLHFPLVVTDLEISVADLSSFEYPSVNSAFASFLNFVFLSICCQYHLCFLSMVHLLQTIALVIRLDHTCHIQFEMMMLYLSGLCFAVFLFLRLSHMLCVIFLGTAVVDDVLVFPGCFHFYFISLLVFFLESHFRDVHVYNDYHVLLALVDHLDLKS